MLYSVDVESWHALDHFYPEFSRDPRSVHLGLSMDGFQSYISDSTLYSYWPVACYFGRNTRMTLNVCITVGSDM
jgi:hypothetical protein